MVLCHLLASSKGVVILFNVLFSILGSVLILLGFCVILDDSTPHLLHLLSPPGGPRVVIILLAYLLFFVGCCLIVLACVGWFPKPCLVVTYLCIVAALEFVELVAALSILSYRSSMLVGLQNRLTVKLISDYGHKNNDNLNIYGDNVFTQSLDHTQYTFNCCGVTGAHDYNLSRYFNYSQLSNEPRNVPITCCNRTIFQKYSSGSPISVVSRVFHGTVEEDWQKPHLKQENDCQSSKPGAQYTQGCWEKIQDWLLIQSNWFIIALLVLMVLEFVCTAFFVGRKVRHKPYTLEHPKVVKDGEMLQATG